MQDNQLSILYARYCGSSPQDIRPLAASGSNRRYFRISGIDGTVIGVCGTSTDENKAFLYMSRHFRSKGLPVPEVLACSDDCTCYLQEDLGSESLFDAIAGGRQTGVFSDGERELLRKTITLLPRVQFVGARDMDFGQCYPQSEFNSRSIMWDLNYFKYCFLKPSGLEFQEDRLEDDFVKMSGTLLSERQPTFMYRDFQSRNVMLRNGEPWLIDYQGGRRGPIYYDVASFLWQAKANMPATLRRELAGAYVESMQQYCDMDAAHFDSMLRHFVLFRTLQVLGAYGFRGYQEHKAHFLQSIPYAVKNLSGLLDEDFTDEYPYLKHVLRELVGLPQFGMSAGDTTARETATAQRGLTVRVFSFGYRKGGIPQDDSGNGGGFVFDCRAISNPGRYAEYHQMNGLDRPVIDFLEAHGEVQPFLEHAYAVVDASVRRYMQRGFSSLMVSFGCTGGQHRSVYCAQHMAEHISRTFGIGVKLLHKEQGISQTFNPKDI